MTNSIHLPIILASTSPRRKQLLGLSAFNFKTLSVDIDEQISPSETATAYIERMIAEKAQAGCDELSNSFQYDDLASDCLVTRQHKLLLITADTIGVLPNSHELKGGQGILVKPTDKADAFSMWAKMSGKTHSIWTAVLFTLVAVKQGKVDILTTRQITEQTEVTFIDLDEYQMESYWQTGEPQDKAGAYAIQGHGALWIDRINGSYTNVVGLPLAQTVKMIEDIQASIGES